ncbi:MAG: group II truncated hemoglobin [Rudaea sp.]
MSASIPTLFEWIGGLATLDRLTDNFYRKVKADALLGPVFARMDAHHPQYVARFIAEVFGGPSDYSTQRGGHAQMIRQHVERRLDEAKRQRWIALLLETADEIGVAHDPEFRSAFVAYIEWGTRIAVINSQPGAEVQADQPMPRWGWGEVKGPYTGA